MERNPVESKLIARNAEFLVVMESVAEWPGRDGTLRWDAQ